MNECIFCKIVNGEIPCYKVYEDDDVLAFLDISQTILDGYFNMMMIVDNTHAKSSLDMMSHDLETIGNELGVVAKIQHENIFAKMHRI